MAFSARLLFYYFIEVLRLYLISVEKVRSGIGHVVSILDSMGINKNNVANQLRKLHINYLTLLNSRVCR